MTIAIALTAAVHLAAAGYSYAAPASPGPVHLLATIQIPGKPLKRFDISWVDQTTRTYYFADQSNFAVDIINAADDTFVGRVTGFVGPSARGYDNGGPNGVMTIPGAHQLWAGDGNGQVEVIDLAANPPRIVRTIHTGSKERADELAYDAKDGIVMIANSGKPPFLSFITAASYAVLGKLDFPDAPYGVEQSVWDAAHDRFYVSVPVVGGMLRQLPRMAFGGVAGEIAVIDPVAMKVVRRIEIKGCAGSGLALGPHGDLLEGCFLSKATRIVNPQSGAVTDINQVGGSDEVWFNSGDHRYYLGAARNHGGPVLGVIDADNNRWLQNAESAPAAHSVAADAADNHVFVPLAANKLPFDNDRARHLACTHGCVGVYGVK